MWHMHDLYVAIASWHSNSCISSKSKRYICWNKRVCFFLFLPIFASQNGSNKVLIFVLNYHLDYLTTAQKNLRVTVLTLCVCVCLSVTTLAATSFISKQKQCFLMVFSRILTPGFCQKGFVQEIWLF